MRADRVLSPDQARRLHDIYLEAFGALRTSAAARHVLSDAEFLDEM